MMNAVPSLSVLNGLSTAAGLTDQPLELSSLYTRFRAMARSVGLDARRGVNARSDPTSNRGKKEPKSCVDLIATACDCCCYLCVVAEGQVSGDERQPDDECNLGPIRSAPVADEDLTGRSSVRATDASV